MKIWSYLKELDHSGELRTFYWNNRRRIPGLSYITNSIEHRLLLMGLWLAHLDLDECHAWLECTEKDIPNVVNFIWVGPNRQPEYFQDVVESWRHTTGAEIKIWDNEKLPYWDVLAVKCAVAAKDWVAVCDIGRSLLVRDFGGIYVDCDMYAIRDITPLLDSRTLALPLQADPLKKPTVAISNCFLAAAPANPIMSSFAAAITTSYHQGQLAFWTGPLLYSGILMGLRALGSSFPEGNAITDTLFRGINLLNPDVFFGAKKIKEWSPENDPRECFVISNSNFVLNLGK